MALNFKFHLGIRRTGLKIDVSPKTMTLMGQTISRQIKNNITYRKTPSGSPQSKNEKSTIDSKKRRGSIGSPAHPLLQTGQLRDAIYYKQITKNKVLISLKSARVNTWRKNGYSNIKLFRLFHGLSSGGLKGHKTKRYYFWGYNFNSREIKNFAQMFYRYSKSYITLRS